MGHPDAAAILRALAEKHRPELEAVYRSILLDALDLPDEQRMWWADLTDAETISEGLGRVEAAGWLAAVEALWLDTSLEHGFPAPIGPEPPEGQEDA